MGHTVFPSPLWANLQRLLGKNAARKMSVSIDGVYVELKGTTVRLTFEELTNITYVSKWLGSRIIVHAVSAHYVLRGVSTSTGNPFVERVRTQWVYVVRRLLEQHEAKLIELHGFIDSVELPSRYVRHSQVMSWRAAVHNKLVGFPSTIPTELQSNLLATLLQGLWTFIADPFPTVVSGNTAYLEHEISETKELFDTVESRPLSDEQRRAVVTDEDHNLVVAAAGSGKTSVIVAKVAHLISRRHLDPHRILVLAFNRAAADEIRERLANQLELDIADAATVSTFHALGLSIIGEATGRKPSLAKHAEESWRRAQVIGDLIEELRRDDPFERLLLEWFAWHYSKYKSVFDFGTLGEYYAYLRDNNIVSLKGDLVKSFEECVISNFLYLNGVHYEYEAKYEHDTADAQYSQYRPDFFYPGTGSI